MTAQPTGLAPHAELDPRVRRVELAISNLLRTGVAASLLLIVLGTAFANSTERGDDMMLVMMERGCQAIRDLGSLDLVRAL